MRNGSVLSKSKIMSDNRRLPNVVLLGKRKENHSGQLTGKDTHPIPKLL